jgi:type II secretory pathway pseudopilin PulG
MRTGDVAAHRVQTGFAYVLLLLAVALISIAATAAVTLGATMARRDAERELLAIGAEFQQALRSYTGVPVAAAAATVGQGPRTLEDLLKDPRVPGIRRHLRQLYADPLTGKSEWGLILDAQGRIAGVHSLAQGKPIRRTGFEPQFAALENAETYGQWVFGLPAAVQAGGAARAPRENPR